MEILLTLIVAGVIMGLLDFIWLGYAAKKLYYGAMGNLLREKPNMAAAVLFYVIYVVGVVVFAINPALDSGSVWQALSLGAFFGFVAYATYDLTNLSTMKGFPKKIVVIDMIWGTTLTAVVATLTYLIIHLL
ncbi:MAG: DUF2177 family protein [Candidatus Saccharimonas sp.]